MVGGFNNNNYGVSAAVAALAFLALSTQALKPVSFEYRVRTIEVQNYNYTLLTGVTTFDSEFEVFVPDAAYQFVPDLACVYSSVT